jgi:hypothetical protein
MRAEPRRYRSRVPAREIRFCGLPRLQHQQCRVALRLFGTLSFHASGGAFFACRRERSAFRASRCRSVASRGCTAPHRSWGTEGSNPAPTREATANPDFRAHADAAIPQLFVSRLRRAGGTQRFVAWALWESCYRARPATQNSGQYQPTSRRRGVLRAHIPF